MWAELQLLRHCLLAFAGFCSYRMIQETRFLPDLRVSDSVSRLLETKPKSAFWKWDDPESDLTIRISRLQGFKYFQTTNLISCSFAMETCQVGKPVVRQQRWHRRQESPIWNYSLTFAMQGRNSVACRRNLYIVLVAWWHLHAWFAHTKSNQWWHFVWFSSPEHLILLETII